MPSLLEGICFERRTLRRYCVPKRTRRNQPTWLSVELKGRFHLRFAYSEVDLESLELSERERGIFRAVERGRKKGADLVILPAMDGADLRETLSSESFLKGTCDYPDMTILFLGKDHHGGILYLVSEGRVLESKSSNEGKLVVDLSRYFSLERPAELAIAPTAQTEGEVTNSSFRVFLAADATGRIRRIYSRGRTVNLDEQSALVIFDLD